MSLKLLPRCGTGITKDWQQLPAGSDVQTAGAGVSGLPIPQPWFLSLKPSSFRGLRNITVPQSMQTPLNSPSGKGTPDPHQEQASSSASDLRNLNVLDITSAGIETCLSSKSVYKTGKAIPLFSPPAFVIL
jgi:hypothetical protein